MAVRSPSPRSDTRLPVVLLWLLVTGGALAGPLGIGDPVPDDTFLDQFDTTHRLSDCEWLLFAPDRAAADIANRVMSAGVPSDGVSTSLCYVADIAGMPAVISRLFAVPAMRDYTYSVLLDRDGSQTADWPRRPEQLTVIGLDDGRVVTLGFAASAEQALGSLATPAP
jgi:hypothetical protein